MGLVFGRRPLLRGAMLASGGAMAYQAGRRREAATQYEQQTAAMAQYPPGQGGQGAGVPPPAYAPTPAPASEADKVQALADLKNLLDQGAITQAEFDAEKRKLLGG